MYRDDDLQTGTSQFTSTFVLGLDNELLALLLQCVGGSAGVGPWEK